MGASCHNRAELEKAAALGLDYAVLGNVKQTLSHPERPPLGWEAFAGLREDTSLPLYAIGGLGRDDVAAARRQGAQGVAAIRGLWDVPKTMAGR